MDRKGLSRTLEEVALLLDLKGENPFKIRAYQQAARIVLAVDEDLTVLAETGGLGKIKGIGKALEEKIGEYISFGRLEYLDELKSSFPEGLLDILDVKGLGPKKVRLLYEELGITSLGELEYACLENRLVSLKGFGAATQKKALKGVETLKKYRGFSLWAEMEEAALELVKSIADCQGVERCEPAGGYRRANEVVDVLDIVVSTGTPDSLVSHLNESPLVQSKNTDDPAEIILELKAGFQARIHPVRENTFAAAWHYHTGSSKYLVAIQALAEQKEYELSESGLKTQSNGTVEVRSEEQIFTTLGLGFIPPELREGRGEIEAAGKKTLPDLVSTGDIKGIFHVHSTFTDGGQSIVESVNWCLNNGYQYLGLADHSQTASYAGGLTPDGLERQLREVEAIRRDFPDFGLFWGIESDIRTDGSLDYPDDILAEFDFIVASVHSGFTMGRDEMTTRLVNAVRNPYTTLLGHPTGRLLLAREPYQVDLEAVISAAAETGTVLEINASPQRLDLDWREMRGARELGVKMMINPDAHSVQGLGYVRYGVNVARKGWLESTDVLNCLDRTEMSEFLKGFSDAKRVLL
ncbi:MAG: DNA polymerase/3'-5' exonuclease PolX [Deltaproteobacteria bacterium]|nr:DNA polymerase/3'-5' exonuclease PolX [Deltaproteobacteria bacterium]